MKIKMESEGKVRYIPEDTYDAFRLGKIAAKLNISSVASVSADPSAGVGNIAKQNLTSLELDLMNLLHALEED